MSKLIWLSLIICISNFVVSAQNCKYDKNGVQNPPFVWMWNKLITKKVQQIRGTIMDNNEDPISETTVALFQESKNKYVFIGSLDTDENGRFCFNGFKKGKYLLKIGHRDFQGYDIEIIFDPRNKSGLKELQFILDIGY